MLECAYDEFSAATEREGEAMTLVAAVGFEDAVGGGVVGVLIDGVGTDVVARSGKSQIDDPYIRDGDVVQSSPLEAADGPDFMVKRERQESLRADKEV